MLSLLEKLSCLPGVSGNEDAVRDFIAAYARKYTDRVDTDMVGNVIVFKKGRKPAARRVLFAAHMDEVGFIISQVTSEGFLRFKTVGGIDPMILPGTRVLAGERLLPGVIGVKPVHLLKKEDKHRPPSVNDLFINIGAASEGQVHLSGIMPGDWAVFDSGFRTFGDGFIKGKALDDRAGCALLLSLLSEELEYDAYFAFHVQEEEGLRGAYCSAFQVKPDIAVVVEATTAADISLVEKEKRVCELRKGPVLSFLDGRTLYDRELYEQASAAAEENNIKWQPKAYIAGGNDAGAIQPSGEGVRTLAVSLPCRYLHTPSCVIHEEDMNHTFELLKSLAERFGGDHHV